MNNPKKGNLSVSAAITVIVVGTIILCGILYIWVGSLIETGMDTSYLEKQEIPSDPTSMNIDALLEMEYVRKEGELQPVFDLSYHATFGYEASNAPTVTYIPLPDASIEDLEVSINGTKIDLPNLVENQVRISLSKETTNKVEIKYKARGSMEYRHTIPKNRFIRHFQMETTIKGINSVSWENMLNEGLSPDSKEREGNTVVLSWDKQNAVLKKDIAVTLPTREDPIDSLGTFLFLLILMMIIELIIFYRASLRLNLKWKNDHLAFLCAPFIITALVVALSLIYFHESFAMLASMILFLPMMLFSLKKMIGMKKGLMETFIILGIGFSFLPVSFFLRSHIRLVAMSFLSICILLLGLNFIRKYKNISPDSRGDPIAEKVREIYASKKEIDKIKETL